MSGYVTLYSCIGEEPGSDTPPPPPALNPVTKDSVLRKAV